MKSYRELLEQRAQLDAEIATTWRADRESILNEIQRMMRNYAITFTELAEHYARQLGPRTKIPGVLNTVIRQTLPDHRQSSLRLVENGRDTVQPVPRASMLARDGNPVCTSLFHDLTEDEWYRVAPLLSGLRKPATVGRPPADARAVFNGVLWVLYTYAPWNAMPPHYPQHAVCHRRFQIWRESGTLGRVVKALSDTRGDELDELITSRTTRRTARTTARHRDFPAQPNYTDGTDTNNE